MISYEHDKMIFDDVRGKGDENYADLLHSLNVHIVMMIMAKYKNNILHAEGILMW